MKRFVYKAVSVLIAVLTVMPMLLLAAGATTDAGLPEAEKLLFIDGENVTREVNTAIVYRGVASTGQSQWGHDIVVDADGTVTDIIEGGLSEGEDLAVPEGGMVISAAGAKVQWMRDNIAVGTKLFYDGYTRKLFVCDASGMFDPYFTKTAAVSGTGNYLITNPAADGAPYYTYSIAVDASGMIVARGSGAAAPEGGFLISAATEDDMQFLLMYAPVGAGCTVADGVATFTYNATMLKRTAETALLSAEAKIYSAKMEFADIDFTVLDAAVAEISAATAEVIDYKALSDIMMRIEAVTAACCDREQSELRGAFHTPDERDINEVRATVNTAKSAGLNTIILRATNGYGTFIPLPSGNKFSQDPHFGGFDVLKAYIDVCAEENIALVLSVDVYYNEYASIAAPEWMSETNTGEVGLSDKYYSPSSAEFREYFVDYVRHIVGNYDIDSIMFDYLRYPKFSENCDYGYDYITLQTFAEANGITISEVDAIKTELFASPHWEAWVEYRKGLVTEMAESLDAAIKELRTDVTVIAVSARDSVDYFYMQDSIGWIESGIFDGLCVALYERDESENDPIDELGYADGIVAKKGEIFGAYTAKEKFFLTALDAGTDTGELSAAVSESRNIGADGIVFSNMDEFLMRADRLCTGVLNGSAVSPLGNTVYAMKLILEYSKTKINDSIVAFGGCDEETASAALEKINEAIMALGDGALSYETASTLESDIAMLFASSAAKHSVLKEFEAVTKLALLHKTATAVTPPDIDKPDFSGDESGTPDESSTPEEDNEGDESAGDGDGKDESAPDFADDSGGIAFGDILIYLFVGITAIAALTATVVGIRRKSRRPANRHMPRAVAKDAEESGEEE